MSRAASPTNADEKGGETTGVKNAAHIVNLQHLLPSGLLEVVLRADWRVIKDEGAHKTDDAVDDADIVAPAPLLLGVLIQSLGDQYPGGGVGDADAKFSQADTKDTDFVSGFDAEIITKALPPFVRQQFHHASVCNKHNTAAEPKNSRARG